MGVKLSLQLELYFEHASPEPARALGACAPGVDADSFRCDAHFTPQPRVTPRWLHRFYHIPAKLHGGSGAALQGNAMAAVEFMGKSFDPLDVAQYVRVRVRVRVRARARARALAVAD